MPSLDDTFAADLEALTAADRYRRRRTVQARVPGTARLRVDDRDVVAFCGNDYLGLADHPRLVAACVEATQRWGVGSGASHLVSGHCEEHHALEAELAEFTRRPRALLFSTGYMANLAVGSALLRRGDRVLEDRLNHASLLDAGRTSGASFERYAHGDVDDLRRRLAAPRAGRTLVATDGVFSMDGDVAPLTALAADCRDAGATLFVDDAHGCGVLGPHGGGAVEAAGLGTDDVPVLMCTLGKALGTFGAFVAGSEALIESLIQRGRTYIYTTALPPAVAAATRAALQVAREESWRRTRVLAHARRFADAARGLGLQVLASSTPIQPLLLGREADALAASRALWDRGLWVPAIRPPTVPPGTSRLRVTFSAAHTDADLDRLIEGIASLAREGRDA